MLPYDKRLIDRSRKLRKEMTPAEKYLWSKLKSKQLGYWFYRQKPIGIYIADFYCPHGKLVIEIDGNQHFSNQAAEYDKERSNYLKSIGQRILRFTNQEALTNIDKVIFTIRKELG
jgi:very-short-patch-repair endonuclease